MDKSSNKNVTKKDLNNKKGHNSFPSSAAVMSNKTFSEARKPTVFF